MARPNNRADIRPIAMVCANVAFNLRATLTHGHCVCDIQIAHVQNTQRHLEPQLHRSTLRPARQGIAQSIPPDLDEPCATRYVFRRYILRAKTGINAGA